MEYELSEDQFDALLIDWSGVLSSLKVVSFSQMPTPSDGNLLLLALTNPKYNNPLRIACYDVSHFQGNLREAATTEEITIYQNCSGWVIECFGKTSMDWYIQAGRITVNQKPQFEIKDETFCL